MSSNKNLICCFDVFVCLFVLSWASRGNCEIHYPCDSCFSVKIHGWESRAITFTRKICISFLTNFA